METPITISRHNHPMIPSSGFAFRCYWCKTGGYIKNGYHCPECDIWFHKDCGNSKLSFQINHTSHPEHLLSRRPLANWLRYWCNVCKRRIDDDWAYDCSICQDFSLHVSCAREAPPLTIKHPQAHDHPLVFFPVSRNSEHLCKVCKEKVIGKVAYRCFKCRVVIHVECANSLEVNHPCHTKHSLKLLTSGAPNYTDDTCLLCSLKLEGVLYHCSICNFSVCLGCANVPPPLDVKHLKTHEHKLTLMARQMSFNCNACGMQGDRSPYLCLQCHFMVHQSCIGLPRIINISYHNHRISHTRQLSFGDWVCRVCLQNVNRFYGAYSCSVCINYIVHSQCATRNDVWDGKELEGIPEETKDVRPFKEVADNLINHFSHDKHYLKLNKDGTTLSGNIRCEACMLLVYSDPVYSCETCGFVLHVICANLPLKKQHMFHNKPFTLHFGDIDSPKAFPCSACGEFFNGFRYESDHVVLDVKCILISELFSHENHEHPLHYNKKYIGKCDACHGSVNSGAFSCKSCEYNLDFHCASLPKIVKHSWDQHPFSLSCKQSASGKYWCDICEEEMDPNKWLYTCNDCEVTLHVKCALGDLSRLKPGRIIELREERFVVISNNHSSRPTCSACGLRCKAPFILKAWGSDMFVCSQECFPVYAQIMRAAQLFRAAASF
ncbi:hypothetical protein EUTSA_v10012095mg [Eutrema salsugineum]|uniref:Phorbol-ester/DAG-type domain-containing protein n=1 Tax=Eutrema salsugineum TaxID=72664 RepID=V4JZH2_EUTSA|nr:hypothetical protein EUTSA_v10012095mg [Eutrema salsugineum]